MFYTVLYLSIRGHWLAKAASALASYFDPRIIFIIFPMDIFRSRSQAKNNQWQSLLQQAIFVVIVWLALSSRQSLQNAYNILMVEDPTITIGSFWYMMAEMFKDHLLFLKLLYILQQAMMCIFTTIHITSTFNAIDKKNDGDKQPKKRQNLLLNGILILCFVKLVMNQYPCLHDLSLTVFVLSLNLGLVGREITPIVRFLFFCVVGFGMLTSSVMWVTWTQRFSGNANFFWF